MNKEEMYNKVQDLIKEIVHNKDIEFNEHLDMINDLGMDSISMMGLLVRIENMFGICIPDEKIRMDYLRLYEKFMQLLWELLNENKGE